MSMHPALTPGRVAVVTGAASGIGLAAAARFAALGMHVCLADLSPQALDKAAEHVAALALHCLELPAAVRTRQALDIDGLGPDLSIDDVVIGVKAVDKEGNQSVVSCYTEPVLPGTLTPAEKK